MHEEQNQVYYDIQQSKQKSQEISVADMIDYFADNSSSSATSPKFLNNICKMAGSPLIDSLRCSVLLGLQRYVQLTKLAAATTVKISQNQNVKLQQIQVQAGQKIMDLKMKTMSMKPQILFQQIPSVDFSPKSLNFQAISAQIAKQKQDFLAQKSNSKLENLKKLAAKQRYFKQLQLQITSKFSPLEKIIFTPKPNDFSETYSTVNSLKQLNANKQQDFEQMLYLNAQSFFNTDMVELSDIENEGIPKTISTLMPRQMSIYQKHFQVQDFQTVRDNQQLFEKLGRLAQGPLNGLLGLFFEDIARELGERFGVGEGLMKQLIDLSGGQFVEIAQWADM